MRLSRVVCDERRPMSGRGASQPDPERSPRHSSHQQVLRVLGQPHIGEALIAAAAGLPKSAKCSFSWSRKRCVNGTIEIVATCARGPSGLEADPEVGLGIICLPAFLLLEACNRLPGGSRVVLPLGAVSPPRLDRRPGRVRTVELSAGLAWRASATSDDALVHGRISRGFKLNNSASHPRPRLFFLPMQGGWQHTANHGCAETHLRSERRRSWLRASREGDGSVDGWTHDHPVGDDGKNTPSRRQ